MVNVHDVAAYILEHRGSMSAMKLQKLVFYSQAWHLVWDDEPLFPEQIQAWANGPVAPALYAQHRGRFVVDRWALGKSTSLTDAQRETIDAVLDYYGEREAFWLSELTHREQPWLGARGGLSPGARSDREITQAAMAEYYGGLNASDD